MDEIKRLKRISNKVDMENYNIIFQWSTRDTKTDKKTTYYVVKRKKLQNNIEKLMDLNPFSS